MNTYTSSQLDRLNAALSYAKDGWPVIPLRGKAPLTKHGYKDATRDEALIRQWWTKWPDANIGLVTGKVSGRLVLDIDVKKGHRGDESLRELEEQYGALPITLKSRTASGGWHYVFRMPTGALKSRKGVRDGLDLLADGSYFVAPPSTIANKSYQWVELADVAACPDWIAGLGRDVEDEADEDSPEDRIHRLVLELFPNGKRSSRYWMALCPYHDDHEESLSITLKTGNYRCFSCPAKGSLVELLAKVKNISHEKAQDIVTPVPWYVHELNTRHAIVPVGNKVEIIREDYDAFGKCLGVSFPNQESLDLWYRDQKVPKGRRMATILEMWLEHPRRRKYQKLVFEPELPVPPNIYNMWKGFAVQPRQGDCNPYLEHVYEVWCQANQRYYDYTIAWLADAVQNPRDKKGVALVLLGDQGTGKSLPCEEFGQLFGHHFVTLAQPKGLLGNFNAHFKESLVVLAEEAFWAGDKGAEGALKHLITGRTIRIEPKGKDTFEVNNYIRLMICSNHRWVIPAAAEERRFFVLEVSSCRRGNWGYFEEFGKFMKEGGREALLYFLLHHDYSHINLRDIPQTAALQENKEESMAIVEKFIFRALERGRWSGTHGEWLKVVECEEIHSLYIEHAVRIGQSRRSSETELGKALRKLIPGVRRRQISTKEGRITAWEFPDLDTCRKQFDEVMNWLEHDWPAPEMRPPLQISEEQEKLLLASGVLS